jgi:hypothetical protein
MTTPPPGFYLLTSTDDLIQRIEDRIRKAVSETISASTDGGRRQKRYLTQSEVADLTGWTRRQLAYRRKRGDIPFIKRGKTIWYKAQDVYDWLDAGYVPGTRVR